MQTVYRLMWIPLNRGQKAAFCDATGTTTPVTYRDDMGCGWWESEIELFDGTKNTEIDGGRMQHVDVVADRGEQNSI